MLSLWTIWTFVSSSSVEFLGMITGFFPLGLEIVLHHLRLTGVYQLVLPMIEVCPLSLAFHWKDCLSFE